ncbi:hypothetical protein F4808DRAFT_280061 [Astrocystis sublimbata]|nr:hypothetical protein F4808DRAFT_280061 [Astrocystis sublimbata]
MAEKQRFRVVIVGGGLLGLTAVHMLAKTDMDFVLLEQHDDLLPEIGSLLSFMPSTFRVLDQLDILEPVQPFLTRVAGGKFMSATDAKIWREEQLIKIIEENHGHGMSIVHRPHYVQTLYNTLPAEVQARIHVQKRVVHIDVTDDGVAVHCSDGTVERGDIVLGADGVHSRSRQMMQSLAKGQPASTAQPSPYVTTYRVLFGSLPPLPDLPVGMNYEGVHAGVSTQIITGERQAWWGVYEKIATPTSERLRWTEDDKKAVLEKWGKLYMAPGHTVEDTYAHRNGDAGLISLEEGLVDTWSWKRVVLVGDAVRKLEPHAGQGYNAGVADLVVLVNGLRTLTRKAAATTALPTTEDLETLFRAYQKQRMEDTPAIIKMSEGRARMCAWLGVKDFLIANLVFPYFPLAEYGARHILGPIIARTPVLDWLDEKRLPARAVPYKHHPKQGTRADAVHAEAAAVPSSVSRLPLVTGTLVLAGLATFGLRYYRRI